MAKNKKFNYKNLKINEEELSITKIGEIATENQSPIFIFIFLGILLVFIFFLPNLVDYIKNGFNSPIFSEMGSKNPNKENKEDDSEGNKEYYYNFSEDLIVNLENNIIIDKFSLNGRAITFNVTNNNSTSFSFSKDNYFLEIYTNDNMLLERIILSDIIVSKNASTSFSYEILESTASSIKKISFVKKDVTDYPSVTLEKNEVGEEVLVCTKNTQDLTYRFKDNKLISITDNFSYSNTQESYESMLNSWKLSSETLNNINGITSMFVDTGVSFVVNTVIDLNIANTTNLNNVYYYKYQTEAKVVKFEMDARGFSCK